MPVSISPLDRRTWLRGLFGGSAALGLHAAWGAQQTDAAQVAAKDTIKVTKIETFVLKHSWVFVKVSTDAGITGWGEMLKDDAKACAAGALQGPCSVAASLQIAASIPNFLIQERGDNEYTDLLAKPLPPIANRPSPAADRAGPRHHDRREQADGAGRGTETLQPAVRHRRRFSRRLVVTAFAALRWDRCGGRVGQAPVTRGRRRAA